MISAISSITIAVTVAAVCAANPIESAGPALFAQAKALANTEAQLAATQVGPLHVKALWKSYSKRVDKAADKGKNNLTDEWKLAMKANSYFNLARSLHGAALRPLPEEPEIIAAAVAQAAQMIEALEEIKAKHSKVTAQSVMIDMLIDRLNTRVTDPVILGYGRPLPQDFASNFVLKVKVAFEEAAVQMAGKSDAAAATTLWSAEEQLLKDLRKISGDLEPDDPAVAAGYQQWLEEHENLKEQIGAYFKWANEQERAAWAMKSEW